MVMQIIFILVTLFTVGMAVGAVTARNLFHAALFLVGSFFGVAIVYILLEAEFLAVSQIIIYIGAVATLLVFAIMLSRSMMGREAGQLNRYWPVIGIAVFLAFVALAWLVSAARFDVSVQAVPPDAIAQIGRSLVNEYVIPFEVASIMLLVALIGAIMIARERHP
ncbi:MAG: NADH-quinone oxidoreductase subunit J [Caldilineales bacterium]|nr:NADH-quinone oxidoreductase subunit J [Caldilineales bacterium]